MIIQTPSFCLPVDESATLIISRQARIILPNPNNSHPQLTIRDVNTEIRLKRKYPQ